MVNAECADMEVAIAVRDMVVLTLTGPVVKSTTRWAGPGSLQPSGLGLVENPQCVWRRDPRPS